jgi:hypothetical protein
VDGRRASRTIRRQGRLADPGRVNSDPNGRPDEDGFHGPARRALGIGPNGPGPMFTVMTAIVEADLTAALRGRAASATYLRQPRPFTILMACDEAGRRWVFGTGNDLPSESLAGFTGGRVAEMVQAAAAHVSTNLFRREGEYWTVRYEGSVARLRDAKGLGYLARLLSDPGREFHTVDLAAAGSPAARPGPSGERACVGGELRVRPNLGDAGELLDATAKAAYKARLDELAAEMEEADRCYDAGRAARAGAERDFLVGELARAVGLGGRDRWAASHAERARLNVTRAIRAAMANLARANPALGQHLSVTIRTGRYCSYTPDPRAPITWER